MVVDQRVRNELHILQIGEKIEKGIARLGNENFILWITEQAKYVGVTFAGACRKDDGFAIDLPSVCARALRTRRRVAKFEAGSESSVRPTQVVIRDCLTRFAKTFGLGIVIERLRIPERIEDGSFVLIETRASRIRDGKVEDITALLQQ